MRAAPTSQHRAAGRARAWMRRTRLQRRPTPPAAHRSRTSGGGGGALRASVARAPRPPAPCRRVRAGPRPRSSRAIPLNRAQEKPGAPPPPPAPPVGDDGDDAHVSEAELAAAAAEAHAQLREAQVQRIWDQSNRRTQTRANTRAHAHTGDRHRRRRTRELARMAYSPTYCRKRRRARPSSARRRSGARR